jgi:two-component system, cell cycle sensor histidine kinase and response regulator CckA
LAEVNSAVALAPDEYVNLGWGEELHSGTETILLVEDEAFVREVTHVVLESAGYRVVTARNAVEALAERERMSHVDLLLTDVVLPGKSGRALACDLRSRQPSLVVLFVSGYAMQLSEIEAARPVEAFLPKPFSAAALLRKVRQMLDGKTERKSEPRTGSSIMRACEPGSPA